MNRPIPAAHVNAQILEHIRAGNEDPFTLPRGLIWGQVVVPKGVAGFYLRGNHRGTRIVEPSGGAALVIGNTGAMAGTTPSACDYGYLASNEVFFDGGPAAVAGDFLWIYPASGGSPLTESPVGGGSARNIGGMLRKVASVAGGVATLEGDVTGENGTDDFSAISEEWMYQVVSPSEIAEDVTIEGIRFSSTAVAGQVIVAGNTSELTIQDCDTYGGGNQGIYIVRAYAPWIKRCRVLNCGTPSTGSSYGVEFNTTANGLAEDCYGENVRYVVTRNSAIYNFTERRTRGKNVFAALSDFHGGVGFGYDGSDVACFPGASSEPFGTVKVQHGNSTWVSRTFQQSWSKLDVVQFQINGGQVGTVSDSTIANIQANNVDTGLPLSVAFTGNVLGNAFLDALTLQDTSSGGDIAFSSCTFNCGTRTVVSATTTSVGIAVTLENCTVNTTGDLLQQTGTGPITLTLNNVTVAGGTGTRSIVSGDFITVAGWSGVTVNGSSVAYATAIDRTWTPANLGAKLLAWYDGADVVGADGAAVDSWPIKAGTWTSNATSSGASRPTVDAQISTMGNVRGLAFGATQFLDIDTVSKAVPFSVYMACHPTIDIIGAGDQYTGLFDVRSGGPVRYAISAWRNSADTVRAYVLVHAGTAVFGTGTAASPAWSSPQVLSMSFATGAGNSNVRLNGTTMLTATATSNTLTSLRVGANLNGNSGMNGTVADLVVTDGTETTDERNLLEWYLGTKAGITIPGNPYF